MHRTSLIICALVCCGFTVVTPSMVRQRETLCAEIRRHYGEKSLTAFVKDVIANHPEVDGAKLTRSRVGDRWVTMEWNPFWFLISEDWTMWVAAEEAERPSIDRFTMFWMCDDQHGVFVEGHREESGTLVLDSIRRQEVVKLNWR